MLHETQDIAAVRAFMADFSNEISLRTDVRYEGGKTIIKFEIRDEKKVAVVYAESFDDCISELDLLNFEGAGVMRVKLERAPAVSTFGFALWLQDHGPIRVVLSEKTNCRPASIVNFFIGEMSEVGLNVTD